MAERAGHKYEANSKETKKKVGILSVGVSFYDHVISFHRMTE